MPPCAPEALWEVRSLCQTPAAASPWLCVPCLSCGHRNLTVEGGGGPSAPPPPTQNAFRAREQGVGWAPEGIGAISRPRSSPLPVALRGSLAASFHLGSLLAAFQTDILEKAETASGSHSQPPAYVFCSVPCYPPSGSRDPHLLMPLTIPVFTFLKRIIYGLNSIDTASRKPSRLLSLQGGLSRVAPEWARSPQFDSTNGLRPAHAGACAGDQMQGGTLWA